MHINVLWGKGASEKVDGRGVVETANLLRDHFVKKKYNKEGLVANGKLSDTSTMVFRGRDRGNRMILLLLNTVAAKEGVSAEDNLNQVSLALSYISKPFNPDIRKITIKDDEF